MKLKFIRTVLGASLICGALVGCRENGSTVVTPCETHTWDAGVVTTEPTEENNGIKTYTCTVCKQTKTELIPKNGASVCEHTWNDGEVTTPATTEAAGVKTYTCTKCGDTKTESIPKIIPEQKFTVSYNANGGTGADLVDLNQYSSGDRVTVKNLKVLKVEISKNFIFVQFLNIPLK